MRVLAHIALSMASLALAPHVAADESLFREQVAPIFQRRCLSCHNQHDRKGGLSLQAAASTFAGGDSGEAITAGDPDASYLVELITGSSDAAAEMPKDADPLAAEEVELIRQWIAAGAQWPVGFEIEDAKVADADWWSLAPLHRPALPTHLANEAHWVRTPIDAFILQKLLEHGLRPAAEADRRTLIRRLYFDLLGLPPPPDEIDRFVNDPDPLAYEKLVDRLLDSPHYGERWARHWLDVVHYGDSHGYDKDKPRPNAFPYRDYVIRSFNEDQPYSRFLLEQIAGDVLFPDSADGIIATGFIAAGPWDFISHVEVPEAKIDGQIARSLDRDDMVRTTLETFASATVGCARCHNHKFDPFTQLDYYRLQAVFAAVDRADRAFDADPQLRAERLALADQQQSLRRQQADLQQQIDQLTSAAVRDLDQRIQELLAQTKAAAKPEFGYHSQIERQPDRAKWVQVDLGEATALERIVIVGCHDDFNNIGAGFGFPMRYKIEASNDPDFQAGVTVVVDLTHEDVLNPGVEPQRFTCNAPPARYLRVTATKLAPRQNDYIFALAELLAWTPDGRNAAAGASVTALDSIEAPVRWQKSNLVDGYYFGAQADPAAQREIDELYAERAAKYEQLVPLELRQQVRVIERQLEQTSSALAQLPAPQYVYAAASHFAPQGNFVPTAGTPREIRLLRRGNVLQPGDPVQPGAIAAIEPSIPEFTIPASAAEGDRRAALAQWLADPRHPLTWRSIVNRVWLYHFGRGLVDSPNDFGRMGQLPTHPELLDWLAVEFRDGGQSFKSLHRLICNSATYRQSSQHNEAAAKIDGANQYLWRMNRRRLEAEAIRDSVLAVAGKLDYTMYGPGFQDFVIEKPEHSPHYEYHLHDPEDPRAHRRSVYRFIVRSQQQPFMTTLDCADPSMQVEKRNETVTALQALTLLNNRLMVAMARHFAERVNTLASDTPGKVTAAMQLALGRSPTADELEQLVKYCARHGLENTCRVILNLNEFVFVD